MNYFLHLLIFNLIKIIRFSKQAFFTIEIPDDVTPMLNVKPNFYIEISDEFDTYPYIPFINKMNVMLNDYLL